VDLTYYCIDGNTGSEAFSSTNISAIINTAIDSLLTNGGKLYFRAGFYDFTAPIVIDRPNIHIEGEGSKAVEFRAASPNLTDKYLVKIYYPSKRYYTETIGIKNLLFFNPHWQDYNLTGAIYVNNACNITWFLTIENVDFLQLNAFFTDDLISRPNILQHSTFRNWNVYFPVDYAIKLTGVIDLTMDNIFIYFQNWTEGTHGIYLNATQSSGVTMQAIRIYNADRGIHLIQSDDTRIINSIVDFAGIGVTINESSRVSITNVYSHAPKNTGYGFLITESASNNTGLMSCQAVNCNVGFKDDSAQQFIQSFIGCNAHGSEVKFNIKPEDITQGNLGD